jgi:Dienelactone hydrolase and related enzymes
MQTQFVDYKDQDFVMEGFIAIGESSLEKQPLVLIVHDWSGNNEFVQDKARYFAKQGFISFAVDLYGKGKRGSDTDKSINQKLLHELMQDRSIIVKRLQAALDCVLNMSKVDPEKIMALGFCMGGLCVLDFARSGAVISGAVSVHGLLNPPEVANKTIKAKVLILHGNKDQMVSRQQVAAFSNEMTQNNVDWQIHVFGNTQHAFTNPKANDPVAGLVYNPSANNRTWALVRNFTDELFA